MSANIIDINNPKNEDEKRAIEDFKKLYDQLGGAKFWVIFLANSEGSKYFENDIQARALIGNFIIGNNEFRRELSEYMFNATRMSITPIRIIG